MATGERDPAPAVTRSLRILSVLAKNPGTPLTLSELARALAIAKSSVANICAALETGGMIERVSGGYRLGRRTAELGGAFATQFNQIREFFSVCAESEVLRSELVQISMLDGTVAVYLARYEGRGFERFGTPLGSRLPVAQTATGRAMLTRLSDGEIRELFADVDMERPTDRSVRSVDELLSEIQRARKRGYTLDEGASMTGIVGVAVPLAPWTPKDPPLAMGVALPEGDATEERIALIGAGLLSAAKLLTNPLEEPRTKI